MAAGPYSFQVQAMDAAGVLGDPTAPQTFTQDPSVQAASQAASTGSVSQVLAPPALLSWPVLLGLIPRIPTQGIY